MRFYQFYPSSLLSRYVKYYWFLEGQDSSISQVPQRIFPDGSIELIFHFGDAFLKNEDKKLRHQPTAFVFGQLEQYVELVPSQNIGVMGVKFHPNGLSAFTDTPLFKINQREIELVDLFGKGSMFLHDNIANATNAIQRVGIVERFLLKAIGKCRPRNIISNYIVRDIQQNKGVLPVCTLLSKHNISEKKLERMFLHEVGLSPKTYSRIVRFQQVFRLVQNCKNFTELALEAGYYDQAHFGHEFRSFTGFSPRQYFNEANEFTQMFLED